MNLLINKIKSRQAGFSIIEIFITIFIVSIIAIAMVAFQIDIFSLNKLSSGNLTAQDDARLSLKTMSSEIRTMSPSNSGAYAISGASTSTLTFYTNTDSDSLQEKVRYFLVDKTLKKGVIKPSGDPLTYNPSNETIKELAHDIANGSTPIFSYYDTNYDGTSDPLTEPVTIADIRLIKIEIIIDNDPLKSPGPFSMTTQVSIRNIKDNM